MDQMYKPQKTEEHSMLTAATLLRRTNALQSHYVESDYVRLLQDLTMHLQSYFDFYHKAFVDHIAAAKSLAGGGPAGDDGRAKTGFGQYPTSLLLALRPKQDANTELLPYGHHLGLASILLAHTKAGCLFLSKQTGLPERTVRYAAVRLGRWALTFAAPSEILQTVVALLESHLPAIGPIKPELEGNTLVVGHKRIGLSDQHATFMALLLTNGPVSYDDLKGRGVPHPVKAKSRLLENLLSEGVELQVDSSGFRTYRLRGAVLTVRPPVTQRQRS